MFTPHAWEEFEEWIDMDPEVAQKIRNLIKAIRRDPFKGIGKPESLKHSLKGFWSRRITREHRLVYRVVGKKGEGSASGDHSMQVSLRSIMGFKLHDLL